MRHEVDRGELKIERVIRELGGIISTAELHRHGFEKTMFEVFLGHSFVRVRRGWYAAPYVDEQVVRAVRVGGRLGCVSSLAFHGLGPTPHRLHVCVAANARALRSPDSLRERLNPTRDLVVVHWVDEHAGGDRRATPPVEAMRQADRCRQH